MPVVLVPRRPGSMGMLSEPDHISDDVSVITYFACLKERKKVEKFVRFRL